MENNKKQTAVNWLVSQINSDNYQKAFGRTYISIDIVEVAKEIEKEQIEDAWRRGSYSLLDNGSGEDFDEYYNQTYGK